MDASGWAALVMCRLEPAGPGYELQVVQAGTVSEVELSPLQLKLVRVVHAEG